MPKTEYSSNWMVPPLAPTIRSVWLIVLEKLSRIPTRTFSTPISSATLSAIEPTVSEVLKARLRSDLSARSKRSICRSVDGC